MEILLENSLQSWNISEMCDEVVHWSDEHLEALRILAGEQNLDQSVEMTGLPCWQSSPKSLHHLVILGNDACAQWSNLQV